jgi:bacteriocin-like protein
MELLTQEELSQVSGGDGWDVASGGLTGGGIGATGVGVAVAVGFTVTFPVAVGAIATGAALGAAWEYFTDDE